MATSNTEQAALILASANGILIAAVALNHGYIAAGFVYFAVVSVLLFAGGEL
jgi:hypothetical protein